MVVGIVHAGLAPAIVIAGVMPNLVLVAVVVVTTTFGFMPGITWAFLAGLSANLLVADPLGSIPLAMLVVAAVVAGGGRAVGGLGWVYAPLAALVGSVIADVVVLGVDRLVGEAGAGTFPFQIILPAAILNAALTLLVLLPTRTFAGRYAADDAGAW